MPGRRGYESMTISTSGAAPVIRRSLVIRGSSGVFISARTGAESFTVTVSNHHLTADHADLNPGSFPCNPRLNQKTYAHSTAYFSFARFVALSAGKEHRSAERLSGDAGDTFGPAALDHQSQPLRPVCRTPWTFD